jgi:hypothetical protein
MKKLKLILALLLSFQLIGTLQSLGFENESVNTTYNRGLFHYWIDTIHDGRHLNSRDRILESQSIIPVIIKNNHVVHGLWECPYTGIMITEERQVDIDHIVPLKYAWDHGAYSWTSEKRDKFANDPENLLAVSFSANREKGDKGLNEWLPKMCDYQLTYIKKFNYICIKYGVNQ